MTLIEILFNYREILRKEGREAADNFLHDTCEIALHWHIQKSVHGSGYFLKADGKRFHPTEWEAKEIEKKKGVQGGEACFAGTRIQIFIVENYRRMGWSEAMILNAYPQLNATDLFSAWNYVRTHKPEIDRAIRRNS